MPAPTKNFTTIADAAVDVDSPLDETLLTALRDRDQHLAEWIGYGYTAAQAHSHNGIDSALLQGEVMGAIFAFRNFT